MKRRCALVFALAVTVLALAPSSAVADPNNESATFDLILPANTAEAPSGDRIAVSGGGSFAIHPKAVTASGTFTHTDSEGNLVASGTWTATDLLSFEFYGCGVIESEDVTLPPNFCGGALKLAVTFAVAGTTIEVDGVLTIFCIIGAQAPGSHDEPPEEGITVFVPHFNFNEIVPPNANLYIQTS